MHMYEVRNEAGDAKKLTDYEMNGSMLFFEY